LLRLFALSTFFNIAIFYHTTTVTCTYNAYGICMLLGGAIRIVFIGIEFAIYSPQALSIGRYTLEISEAD